MSDRIPSMRLLTSRGPCPSRCRSSSAACRSSGALEVRVGARRVLVGGREIELRAKEFALLIALVARPGRVLSRGFLLQHVWAYEPDVASRTVDWHVASLRKALGSVGGRIRTIRGAGYQWEDEPTKPD